jgi:light-regulated signal transduction histidine kinase (bacteriophytochrome)
MDITDVKKAQHQAEEYSRKLERSNEELQHFAYVASHDLQEPLRMVISYLTLLQRKFQGSIDDEAQHYIDFAVDGGSRMRHLIDDLLEYSRVETKGKGFVPVDMNKLVARTLAIVKDPAEKSGADIIVDSLPTIVADESQMIQVMQNLIGNAIKFHGPERPMIHVTASIESGEWKFAVRDNGIGMDIKHSDRIFQMFQRLHTKEEYPGTGVGLAIAKKIIERHGGRIWVESDEGKGTVFFFTIPAIHQDSRTQ